MTAGRGTAARQHGTDDGARRDPDVGGVVVPVQPAGLSLDALEDDPFAERIVRSA